MKTYIRKTIKGYYIEFPEEIDAQYWKDKIGSTYEDFIDDKWILLSDELLNFHEEHPEANIKQVLDMSTDEHPIRTLGDAKFEKILQIKQYDSSDNINSFDIISNGSIIATSWLNPAERSNYKSSIDAAELVGLSEVSFYVGEMLITLPTEIAKTMLALILLYADQCFIITKQHISAVNTLDSIESVDSYNITANYPDRLSFTL